MLRPPRALPALVTGALAVTLLAAPPAGAATPVPPVQDVSGFCAELRAPAFADVPADDVFGTAVRCIATAGVTRGGPGGLPADRYGPALPVTRGQMASFVARTLDAAAERDPSGAVDDRGVERLLPHDGRNRFADVAATDPHVGAVNRLAAAGIVRGRGGQGDAQSYAAADPVTRAQMASFLNRAAAFLLGQDPVRAGAGAGWTAPAGAEYFTDLGSAAEHRANVDGLASVGITTGVGGTRYAPDRAVTRAQMAGFLARTLAQLFDEDLVLGVTPSGLPLTAMTRNVYLGTDIGRPLRPAPQGVPPQLALANQVHEMRRIVGLTDFPTRAVLLAKEIADTRPDVVGLQEVATWRKGPFNPSPQPDEAGRFPATASEVEFDFLASLLAELARAGTPYEVVGVQAQSDVEAPGFRGTNPAAPDAEAANYRLTMHDVLLKRAGSLVEVETSGGESYEAVLPFELGGYRYEFVRGYNWADVRVGADRYRVLNTHLESQLSSFAMFQAQELVRDMVLPSQRPVVMVCDCNSDPLDTSTKQGEPIAGIKHQDPYLFLRQHLDDAWLDLRSDDPGFTSGLNETVDEPAPASFTHRIDLVLTRDVAPRGFTATDGVVVGADPANRAPSRVDAARLLWPSDHAGVVVRLRPGPVS